VSVIVAAEFGLALALALAVALGGSEDAAGADGEDAVGLHAIIRSVRRTARAMAEERLAMSRLRTCCQIERWAQR
jgi:hypothetical protein